jgi:outer membrane protein TolC
MRVWLPVQLTPEKKMKTELIKILIAFILAGIASSEIRSQHLPDSLAVYLEIAARENPGVQKALFEYQAALQKVPQAGSLPDPELSAGVFLKPMELMSGNQVADFQLMQMFPWFGVLRSAKDEMSLMAQAKYELFRDAKIQVGYDVQKAWFELFKVREGIRISEKNIEILRTIERLSLVKYKSAGSGLADLYRIQIEILGLEDNIASLKNQERTSVARFNSILDRDPALPVYVDTIAGNYSVGFAETMDLDSLVAGNPMLKMISYENQSLEARKRMISGMSYPMVGIGINYSLINKSPMSESAMNGSDMVMPMVTVTIPVYRKKYNAMKSETDLLKSSSEQSYRATANSLKVELFSAMLDYQDTSRRVKLYEGQRSLASRSLDLMLKDFSSSASSLTDVLRLRQQIYEHELNLIEASADLNIASAWITRLMASSTN